MRGWLGWVGDFSCFFFISLSFFFLVSQQDAMEVSHPDLFFLSFNGCLMVVDGAVEPR